VGALQQAASLECLEVAADRHLGDRKELGQRRNPHDEMLVQELLDPPVTFRWKRLLQPSSHNRAPRDVNERERVCSFPFGNANGGASPPRRSLDPASG